MPAALPPQGSILLVEDQEDDALLVTRAIERAEVGLPVVHLKSAIAAMSYLNRERPYLDPHKYPPPKLVLLDTRMPQMDGFDLLRWIRGLKQFSKLPVAMLTGSDRVSDAQTAYKLGATSFFVKPFDFADVQDLARTLRRLINMGQAPMP